MAAWAETQRAERPLLTGLPVSTKTSTRSPFVAPPVLPPAAMRHIAVIDPFYESVLVLINGRDGTYDRSVSLPFGARALDILVSHVTRDKRPDIVLTMKWDASSWILINKGVR